MSINYTEFVNLYLYCTRDHNTGFNPAWEYLIRSEMQQNWYAFEYLHHRFLKKASIESGGVAARIAFAAAFGAASGAVTGPAGAGVGAAVGAVGMAIDRAVTITTRSSINKGKRQWKLHKARAAMGHQPQNFDLSLLRENEECFRLLTSNGYYFWPGYAKFRSPMSQWLSLNHSAFHRLKARFFFKPPKSGERINNYNFSYTCMLYDINEASRKQFDIIWQVSKFWPMLDYHFFNQSFYTQLQLWKAHPPSQTPQPVVLTRPIRSPELLKSFLFTARYYFLSRDFYLDHFFTQALPKYEIILSRPYLKNSDAGGVTGFNVFQRFLEVLQHKIPAFVLDKSPVKKIYTTNQISNHISNACVPYLLDLPTEMKIEFQRWMRGMFLEYGDLESSGSAHAFGDAHAQNSQITAQNEKNAALINNEDKFDAAVENTDYSDQQKKFQLRALLQKRRQILMGSYISALDFKKEEAKIWAAFAQIQGEPTAMAMNVAPEVIDWKSDLKEKLPDSKAITDITTGAVVAGIKISTEIIGGFAYDAMTSRLSANQKEIFLNVRRIYGNVRLLGGMADFVCRAASGSSLLETAGITGAAGSVTNVFLIGPNLLNVLVAYAVQRSKNFLYYRMDQICLSIVDKLVVRDSLQTELDTIEQPASISTIPAMPSPTAPAAPAAAAPATPSPAAPASAAPAAPAAPSPAAAPPVLTPPPDVMNMVIKAGNYAADAKIFVNSSEEFKNSSLVLPGVISPWDDSAPSYIDIQYKQNESFVSTNACARISLYGSCRARGLHILLYAGGLTQRYYQTTIELSEKSEIDLHAAQLHSAQQHSAQQHSAQQTLNLKQSLAMTQAWYRATHAAFKLLQLEKSIQIQEKTKSHHFSYVETQDVYAAVLQFIEFIIEDKKEFINLLTQCDVQSNTEFSRLPDFIKSQHVFMRVLYLSGISLYKNWLKHFAHTIPHVKAKDSATPDGLQRSELLKVLIERVHKNYFKANAIHENVDFIVQAHNSKLMDMQKSQFNYEGLDKPSNQFDNLHYLTTKLKLDMEKYYLASIKTQTAAHIPIAPFRDFSDLGLGFKFTKDPNLMSQDEKSCLYNDFGRVVRHLFEAAPEPSKISVLQDNLQKILEQISSSETRLNRKLLSDFIDAYFEYSRTLLQLNVFIYYANVYQFIQETVRQDFLNSTLPLRSQILADLNNPLGPFQTASPGEYKNHLEEIKLMCEQLNNS